jgi:hypothetical protein
MTTKHENLDSALNELLFEGKPLPRTDKESVLDGIAKLKAMLNRPMDVHETDSKSDPGKLRQLVTVLGDVAVHGRMFRRDPRDNHERTPSEVRDLVAALCRRRGTSAVMDMVLSWRGFRIYSLPQETKDALTQALDLAADFWKTGAK